MGYTYLADNLVVDTALQTKVGEFHGVGTNLDAYCQAICGLENGDALYLFDQVVLIVSSINKKIKEKGTINKLSDHAKIEKSFKAIDNALKQKKIKYENGQEGNYFILKKDFSKDLQFILESLFVEKEPNDGGNDAQLFLGAKQNYVIEGIKAIVGNSATSPKQTADVKEAKQQVKEMMKEFSQAIKGQLKLDENDIASKFRKALKNPWKTAKKIGKKIGKKVNKAFKFGDAEGVKALNKAAKQKEKAEKAAAKQKAEEEKAAAKQKAAEEKAAAEQKAAEEKADKLGMFSGLRRAAKRYQKNVLEIIGKFQKIYDSHEGNHWTLPNLGKKLNYQGPVAWCDNLIKFSDKVKGLKLDKKSEIQKFSKLCNEQFGESGWDICQYIRGYMSISLLAPGNKIYDLPSKILNLAERLNNIIPGDENRTWDNLDQVKDINTLITTKFSGKENQPFEPVAKLLDALQQQCLVEPSKNFVQLPKTDRSRLDDLILEDVQNFKEDVDKFGNEVGALCKKYDKSSVTASTAFKGALLPSAGR